MRARLGWFVIVTDCSVHRCSRGCASVLRWQDELVGPDKIDSYPWRVRLARCNAAPDSTSEFPLSSLGGQANIVVRNMQRTATTSAARTTGAFFNALVLDRRGGNGPTLVRGTDS
jgi:hypothetical protein